MWELPGPGIEPVSPALAGGFLTTVPPGKPPDPVFTGNTVEGVVGKNLRPHTQMCKKCIVIYLLSVIIQILFQILILMYGQFIPFSMVLSLHLGGGGVVGGGTGRGEVCPLFGHIIHLTRIR